jgi:hypothetical protein
MDQSTAWTTGLHSLRRKRFSMSVAINAIKQIGGVKDPISFTQYSPDGASFALATKNTIKLYMTKACPTSLFSVRVELGRDWRCDH